MAISTLRGISFPFRKGDNGFPEPNSSSQTVIDNVFALLRTARREVPMGNEIGVNVYRFVMETSGPLLGARISQDVRSIIRSEEPRMSVLGITSSERNTGSGTVMEVAIEYEIADEEGSVIVPVGGVS